jgi:hypothetical protein
MTLGDFLKAFMEELVSAGMSEEDAARLTGERIGELVVPDEDTEDPPTEPTEIIGLTDYPWR